MRFDGRMRIYSVMGEDVERKEAAMSQSAKTPTTIAQDALNHLEQSLAYYSPEPQTEPKPTAQAQPKSANDSFTARLTSWFSDYKAA